MPIQTARARPTRSIVVVHAAERRSDLVPPKDHRLVDHDP
jgi:hypothetical protein